MAASVLLSPRYRASALVQALWDRDTDDALRRVTGDVVGRKLLLVRGRVVARSLLQRVLDDTTPYRSALEEDLPSAERFERMLKAVSVAPRGADSYGIAYAHGDPEIASRVANRLAQLLVEEADEDRATRSRTDAVRLEARLVEARKALEEQGEALERARERPPVDRPGEQGEATGQRARQAVRKAALAVELEAAARELDAARRAYVALENEWRAAETAARTGGGALARFVVVQPASIPTRPFFPNRVQFTLVGLALGLAFGLGASLLSESRDRGVRGPEDLRETLPQPLLAELPLVRTRRRDRRT